MRYASSPNYSVYALERSCAGVTPATGNKPPYRWSVKKCEFLNDFRFLSRQLSSILDAKYGLNVAGVRIALAHVGR